MADPSWDFDALVVGAGPAGSAAALVLARAGRNVCLLERGPFPGSKNMYGGVVYGRILDGLVPKWWEEAPIQRWVTRRATMVVTDDQALTVDYRTEAWGQPPYNGATAFRPDFDSWLAGKAVEAGATLVCSTTATGLVHDGDQVVGVRTDRPGTDRTSTGRVAADGSSTHGSSTHGSSTHGSSTHGSSADGDGGRLRAPIVIACDGANSFLAKEAGLYPAFDPADYTIGVKEVLSLPRHVIDDRFGVRGDHGVDFEIVGCTQGVPGGGFLYTNRESVAIGVVLSLPGLAAQAQRPEEIIAAMKAHPAIAPLVEGGEVVEYSAHVIPEAGLAMMPQLAGNGMLVTGDAAGFCLAAGIWLEGVNYAIGSGIAAAETAVEALRSGDHTTAGLAGYVQRLEDTFVLKNHRKLRHVQHLVLGDLAQQKLPTILCGMAEGMFTVSDPEPKAGLLRLARRGLSAHGVKVRDAARDAVAALRSFG